MSLWDDFEDTYYANILPSFIKGNSMSDTFLVIRGRLDWAKLTGTARPYKGNPKFDKGPSWSVDVTPDKKSLGLLKEHGLLSKLKDPTTRNNDARTEKFLSLKVLENRKDGSKNASPRVTDASGAPWVNGLIGNDSMADVKVKVVDYGETTGVYLQAVRILKHVPYEVNDFGPLSEDDEFFGDTSEFDEDALSEAEAISRQAAADEAVSDTELDDDVPF